MLQKGEVLDAGDIVLRDFRNEDVQDIVRHINDERISRYTLHIPYPYGPQDAEEFLSKNRTEREKGTSLNLAITLKEDGRVIGGIGLMNIDRSTHHAEIGYWLGKEHWGSGIASRCVKRMSRFGFDRLGLQRISAVVFTPNSRSRRVLEGCGFVHEGTMRDRYVLDGRPVDGEIYGLIPRDL